MRHPDGALTRCEERRTPRSKTSAAVNREAGPSVEHVLGNAVDLDQHVAVADVHEVGADTHRAGTRRKNEQLRGVEGGDSGDGGTDVSLGREQSRQDGADGCEVASARAWIGATAVLVEEVADS
jgi:hypothetical protein